MSGKAVEFLYLAVDGAEQWWKAREIFKRDQAEIYVKVRRGETFRGIHG